MPFKIDLDFAVTATPDVIQKHRKTEKPGVCCSDKPKGQFRVRIKESQSHTVV